MAVANDYVTGTITLTNGASTFTGTGTAWRLAGFRDGDRIYVDNLVAVIAPNSISDPLIDSNTAGKLTSPWTGTTGTRTYRMSYKPDGARVTAETRNLIEMLGNGNLENIAGLTPTTNAILRGNVGGTAWEKFNATVAGFALLDDPDASAQLTTLGVSAFMKTLLDDASGADAFTTMGATFSNGASAFYCVFPNGFIVQSGTAVVALAASGFGSITFPLSFSSITSWAGTVVNGDAGNTPYLGSIIQKNRGALVANRFDVHLNNSAGAAMPAGNIRIDYIVAGF